MYYYPVITGELYASAKMLLIDDKPTVSIDPSTGKEIHYCSQCYTDMGNEWILGSVCGKCCRRNHKKVTRR